MKTSLKPQSPRSVAAVLVGASLILLATAGFRCPGNEPSAGDGEGGEPADGGAGGTGGDPQGAGAQGGVGGEGGDGGMGGAQCDPEMTMDDVDNCGACGRACSAMGVETRVCQMGLCRPTCLPGFVDFGFPASADDGCETLGRRVFITADPVSAKFPGVAGADQICQDAAEAVGMLGHWQAWVSVFQDAATDRFLHSNVPYFLLDMTVVANDWTDLTDGTLLHGIDLDEHMIAPSTPRPVWTGTFPDGTTAQGGDCNGWTDDTEGSATIGVSLANNTKSNWTMGGEVQCTAPDVHLYCFEK
ncbi:MAG: hypothetical protein HOW73_10440 [Polyangiaceae bacterium]|nr:hypothetical protein [Polyangiaceae bacterium]